MDSGTIVKNGSILYQTIISITDLRKTGFHLADIVNCDGEFLLNLMLNLMFDKHC
jgi:hypothetical protein